MKDLRCGILAWKISWIGHPGRLQSMGLQSWTQLNNMSTLGLSGWALNAVTSVRVRGGVVQSLSRVRLFATPWTAARQASLSITNSRSSLRLMSIELVMPFNRLILCHPLLLLPSIFRSIRVFPNELALHIRWPKDWSFSSSISPSNE